VKTVMYAPIAILCLVASFHLGSMTAQSSYVDFSADGIIGHHQGSGQFWVLDEDGICWHYDWEGGWTQSYALPVAASEIKFFTRQSLITFSNEAWAWRNDHWESVGTYLAPSRWSALRGDVSSQGTGNSRASRPSALPRLIRGCHVPRRK